MGSRHLVGEDQRAVDVGVLLEVRAEPGAVEEVVAEDERALLAVKELLAEDESLGQSVGLLLDDVGNANAELRAVAEQTAKRVLIVRGRDEKNFA